MHAGSAGHLSCYNKIVTSCEEKLESYSSRLSDKYAAVLQDLKIGLVSDRGYPELGKMKN